MGIRLQSVQDRWRDPILTALAILIAIMIFIVAPLHGAGVIQSRSVGFLFALIATIGVLILSGSLFAVLAMLLAIGITAMTAVLSLREFSVLDVYLDATAWLILAAALISVVARACFAPGVITYHRIIGAVLLYLSIGLVFVGLFAFAGLLIPGSFTGLPVGYTASFASNLVYFSFATLTTTGYGDIVPVHPLARSLCNLEAIMGQLYPATLLARLVTLQTASGR